MERKGSIVWILLVFIVLSMQACGGSGGVGTQATGIATVSLTDAPGDFDHVWVTVKEIWFHHSEAAGPGDSGWEKYALQSPKTVDLLSLSNGVVGDPVTGNISLPVGDYQQLRVVLAGTEESLTPSATTANLQYNNEVQIGSAEYPLRIPDARDGIRLSGNFAITEGGTLRLAVDFDAAHDIVDIQRNGITEYILKPRLGYFDLDNAGAIVGHIDLASAATSSTARFVIKAEQVNDPASPRYHVVRRATIVNASNGKFVLYPLRPGNYDIVIRGIGYKTVIIRGVPVTLGTTPVSGATMIPEIAMTAGSDYSVDGSIASPTGAWVNFYQTLQDGSVPYEIRFRHFNPLTGKFGGFKLSSEQLQVASYVSSTVLSGPTATVPAEGLGQFSAIAGAALYERSVSQLVTSGTGTVSFSALNPKSPPSVPGGNSISGMITKPSGTKAQTLDSGILFVAHGGMIVNAVSISQMGMSEATYTIPNLPGGSSSSPLPLAIYGVDALAWSSSGPARAVAVPGIADLRSGDASAVDMHMIIF